MKYIFVCLKLAAPFVEPERLKASIRSWRDFESGKFNFRFVSSAELQWILIKTEIGFL